MILEQLYLGCLSQASYFIGDEGSGKAAVVDPRRDIDEYVELAAQHGLSIEHAILTHKDAITPDARRRLDVLLGRYL